jgi:2-polyprenyl-6-methoxyphenol hydroxylase-like FAD-dependent oxidoreductase
MVGQTLDIGIVGCGVGGMAAAILLSRQGHRVTVLERFAEPRPIGAGLLLQPTGLAVLDRIGLGDAARNAGARIDGIRGRTANGRVVLDLSYGDLAPGCAGLGIHRGVLFDLLFKSLRATSARLICGAQIAEPQTIGNRVTARDAAGQDHGPFDALLVCDGAHSKLRARYAALRSDPLYRWGCVWATLPDPDNRFAGYLHQRFRSTTTMAGVLPIGRDPALADSTPSVTLFWSVPAAQVANWPQQDFNTWRDELGRMWPELAPLLAGLQGGADFSHATYRNVGLRRWRQGRVMFLGDACHGTSPQLGQGANLALLDAWYLAREMEKDGSIEQAFDRLETRRRGQTDFYRQASKWLTPFYQSHWRPLGWMRDAIFGFMCRLGPTRRLMLTTLAGLRRSWWRSTRLDAAARFDPDAW